MGYQRKINTITLKFEDPEFDGFEVKMKRLSIEKYMQLLKLQTPKDGSLSMETLEGILAIFASSLVSWNLEDEKGKAVAPTLKNLRDLEEDFVADIISAWINAMAGTADPLGENSNSTSDAQVELTLPMETL